MRKCQTKLARLRLSSRGLDTDEFCSNCCVVDSPGGARSRRLPNIVAVTENTPSLVSSERNPNTNPNSNSNLSQWDWNGILSKCKRCSFWWDLLLTGRSQGHPQGRNVGEKSGGTNSDEERGALWPRGERGRDWEEVSPPHPIWGLGGGHCEFSQRRPRRSPCQNGFIVI